jgi:hypothetical protein
MWLGDIFGELSRRQSPCQSALWLGLRKFSLCSVLANIYNLYQLVNLFELINLHIHNLAKVLSWAFTLWRHPCRSWKKLASAWLLRRSSCSSIEEGFDPQDHGIRQHQRQLKYKCYKKEWFYNAEPLCEEEDSFIQYASKLKKKVIFCVNIFKSYITICDIMCSADENKVNSIPFSWKLY